MNIFMMMSFVSLLNDLCTCQRLENILSLLSCQEKFCSNALFLFWCNTTDPY